MYSFYNLKLCLLNGIKQISNLKFFSAAHNKCEEFLKTFFDDYSSTGNILLLAIIFISMGAFLSSLLKLKIKRLSLLITSLLEFQARAKVSTSQVTLTNIK